MKKQSKLTCMLLFTTSLLWFQSCGVGMPISSSQPVNNTTFEVDYLFEHDGCKVYRFMDRGNYVYFTSCKGNTTSFSRDSSNVRIENSIRIEREE